MQKHILTPIPTIFIFLTSAIQAERLVLVGASYGKNILAICEADGTPIAVQTGGPERSHTGHHDVHFLPNGNILFHDTWTAVKEITLGKIVWEYDCTKSNGNEASGFTSTPSPECPMAIPQLSGGTSEVGKDGNHQSIPTQTRRETGHCWVRQTPKGHWLVSSERPA